MAGKRWGNVGEVEKVLDAAAAGFSPACSTSPTSATGKRCARGYTIRAKNQPKVLKGEKKSEKGIIRR